MRKAYKMYPVLRAVFSIFYDKKYLKGRHFENSSIGWKWAFKSILTQKILWFNRHVPWPCSPFCQVGDPQNIEFHPDDLNNFQSHGVYFSNPFGGKIILGYGCYIAPNVGLITTNHDLYDPDQFTPAQDIILGQKCWIGMNAILLPGVVLGDHTVVAAGAVVTQSFPEGHCVLGGTPAKVIKKL